MYLKLWMITNSWQFIKVEVACQISRKGEASVEISPPGRNPRAADASPLPLAILVVHLGYQLNLQRRSLPGTPSPPALPAPSLGRLV